MWHRLLLFLHIRNEFDWAPPGLGPEVNHPYDPHKSLRCCQDCGGGRWHAIHREPYDPRRVAEILANAENRLGNHPHADESAPNSYLDGTGPDASATPAREAHKPYVERWW